MKQTALKKFIKQHFFYQNLLNKLLIVFQPQYQIGLIFIYKHNLNVKFENNEK